MAHSLFKIIKDFFGTHFIPGRPLLLGFSGGTDSTALLDLLCLCRPHFPLDLHLAHVDHGWREESRSEAEELKKRVEELGFIFHLHRAVDREKNEEKAREQRLQFFSALYKELHCQALILAHHQDDQAETVLKRVFEGAHVTHLGAMSFISHYKGMTLWRPLLDIPKKALLLHLKQRGLFAIQDATNFDPRYLRSKMRMEIIPNLSEQFGKEIGPSLCKLAKNAHELHHYFSRKCTPFFSTLKKGLFGSYWDFTPFMPFEKIEVYFALKKFFHEACHFVSHESLELMVSLLDKKAAGRHIGEKVILDRGILFFLEKKPPSFPFKTTPLENVLLEKEGWIWYIACEASANEREERATWRDLWEGRLSFALPDEASYELACPVAYPLANKRWSDHKVPAFLRQTAPLILQNGKLVFEFLSGNNIKRTNQLKIFISIEIKSRD